MSVPAVQDELETLLGTLYPDAQVQYAAPKELPNKPERAYVLDEEDYIRGGGEQYREEEFSPRIVIEVYMTGASAKPARDRRWAMIETLDAALMDADFQGYRTEGGELRIESATVAFDQGWLSRSVIAIALTDRL